MTEIKVIQETDEFNILREFGYKFEADTTLTDLLDQVIKPLLINMGYSSELVESIDYEQEGIL